MYFTNLSFVTLVSLSAVVLAYPGQLGADTLSPRTADTIPIADACAYAEKMGFKLTDTAKTKCDEAKEKGGSIPIADACKYAEKMGFELSGDAKTKCAA